MEPLISPIDKDILAAELKPEFFIKKTNYGDNDIYIITHHTAPNVMQEIGRLREWTFREAKGGTGKEVDIDEFDTMDKPFDQLIVWNPRERDIIGGYRFLHMKDVQFDHEDNPMTPTAELFRFSQKFRDEYMPYTIELGRSFVQPEYQPAFNLRRGMFALDNIWDGLGAIITENDDARYYFGKITMYTHFNQFARDLILYFMNYMFPDPDKLVYPIEPMPYYHPESLLSVHFTGKDYDENVKILNQLVRANGENIPPLVNAYSSLSSTMRSFGTTFNPGFGGVEETGIIVTIADIYDFKKERHMKAD